MTQAQFPKPVRRKSVSVSTTLHAYFVQGEATELLADLPAGACVAIIPSSPAVAAKLDRSAKLTRSDWVVSSGAGKADPWHAALTKIRTRAFEPNARARAILRGVQFAQEDLQEAGGAYDIEEVRALLHGVTRQAVDKKVKEGSLLVVPGPSNRRRFPTLQFKDDGSVVEGLQAVQKALGYSSPWSVLNFLINPQDGLGGQKPIDRLRAGDIAAVVGAARQIGVQGA
ncbi:hypothetical protein [Phenylobacterium sp.]|uniref:hypothetical protein n=1 Tax=Phenylobacterium sp. TaxID=1871053 RepID=UPI0035B2755B